MLKFVAAMFGDVFKHFGGHLPCITEKIIGILNMLENNFPRFFIFLILLVQFLFAV
jgi:type IV pilus assembly protein PilC